MLVVAVLAVLAVSTYLLTAKSSSEAASPNAGKVSLAISNVAVSSMTYSPTTPDAYSVTVIWTTNVPATTWVCSGTTKYRKASDYQSCGGTNNPLTTTHSTPFWGVPGTTMYYVARSDVGDANYVYSQIYSINVPPLDTTAPSVSITAPVVGTVVAGNITIAANASDNVSVSQVQFKVDGILLGTDGTSPYSLNWNSGGMSNGSHSITAIAKDTSSNTTISAPISFTINNISTTTATTTP